MKKLIFLSLFTILAVSCKVFSAGVTVFNENCDNWYDNWGPSAGDHFTFRAGQSYSYSPSSSAYVGFGITCHSVTALFRTGGSEREIDLSDYDTASISMYACLGLDTLQAFMTIQYYTDNWYDACTSFAPPTMPTWGYYGDYIIPNNATKIRIRDLFIVPNINVLYNVQHYIDDIVLTANKRPTLDWTGETGYESDGVNPTIANINEIFTWRINYTDGDNDPPTHIRVHILDNGSEISGSPFAMIAVDDSDTTYTDGKLYRYWRTLPEGSNYTYYFDAGDGWLDANPTTTLSGPTVFSPDISGYVTYPNGDPVQNVTITLTGAENRTTTTNSSGYYVFQDLVLYGNYSVTPSYHAYYSFTPTNLSYTNLQADQINQNFIRNDTNCTLSWTGEENYTADGVNPDTGTILDTFTFSVQHTDAENDMPQSGYPRIHIQKGGSAISGSPFTMSAVDGGDTNCIDGKLYTYSTTLDRGSDHSYYFEVVDTVDISATGTPTQTIAGPIVNDLPVLSWTGETNFIDSGVYPKIATSAETYEFRIKYSDIDNDAPVNGYPQLNILKDGTTIQTLLMNTSGGNYATGIIYSTSTLLSPCSYYSYNFVAYDTVNSDTQVVFTSSGPDVGYRISGYVYYPDTITPFPSATVKIVCVSTRTTTTDSNGYYEIVGSINNDWWISVSSSPDTGVVLFTPDVVLFTNLNAHETYNFYRVDGNPSLDWSNEGGFITDGVNPNIEMSSNTFTFQVSYTDSENDPPGGNYPRLYTEDGSNETQAWPMSYVSGNYTTGAIYSVSVNLDPSSDYEYYFGALDKWGAQASGEPTNDQDGPNVKAYVSGTVVTYDKIPVNNSKVTLQEGFNTYTAYTDSSGEFLFSWLDEGLNYTLIPDSSVWSFNNNGVNFEPLTDNATFQFIRTDDVNSVSGRVFDPTGTTPIPGIPVLLSDTRTDYTVTDSNGYYNFYVTTQNYTIKIPLPSYPQTFTPSSYTISGVQNSINNLDFTRVSRPPTIQPGFTTNAVAHTIILPEQSVEFKIYYTDNDSDLPKTGYPLITITKGEDTVKTLPMNYDAAYSGGVLTCQASTSFNRVGEYSYTITVKDIYGENGTEIIYGSFSVQSQAPNTPRNTSITDGTSVVSGKVTISWYVPDNTDNLIYQLFLSGPFDKNSAPSRYSGGVNYSQIYSGEETQYILTSLQQDKMYYWKVVAENEYGAYSESPAYSFITIPPTGKAFNYPNPFRAGKQNTNFVFEMAGAGNVEVSVYSELGDLCWRKSFFGFVQGTNEISYDGTDDQGKVLYNGSYVCIIDKKYLAGNTSRDSCRILIIK